MKYVTYYYSIMGGLSDVEFHGGKDDAVKFYRKAAYGYFDNLRLPAKTTTPTACGFFHRHFGIMSLAKFKKEFPEYFNAEGGRYGVRLCEFQTDSTRKPYGLELVAWARYKRGEVPSQGERNYIERRVLAKFPRAELVELRRRFVPAANGKEPNEVWWYFRWIDFSHKKEGGAK